MNLDLTWLPLNKNVRIITSHESGIFALEKPAGTMTHPNSPGIASAKNAMLVADYSLKNECYFCRGNAGVVQKIFVLNRLDSPTSGIVLCSANELVAQLVRRAFLEERVRKIYYAIVCGNVPTKTVWKDWLIREKTADGSLRVKIAVHSKLRGAQFAETEVAPTGTLDGNAIANFQLLKLLPHTGRTHQLRVQCAAHGAPILGDKAYGDAEMNREFSAKTKIPAARNRLFLHAGETELAFPWRGAMVNFSAHSPLPPEFSAPAESPTPSVPARSTSAPVSRFRIRVKKKSR